MTRKEANSKILEKLAQANEKYTDLRFGQLLLMIGINLPMEEMYKESTIVLEKAKEQI